MVLPLHPRARTIALGMWALEGAIASCDASAQEGHMRPTEAAPKTARRAPTYGELSREIELRRRELEELDVVAGDRPMMPDELDRKRALTLEIGDLEAKRARLEQAEAAAANDDSVGARWARSRAAFRDLTSWDLRDGMFRFQIGVRVQLDATFGVEDDAMENVVGSINGGLRLRRARVFAKGRLLRAMDFWVELDVGEDSGLKNA